MRINTVSSGCPGDMAAELLDRFDPLPPLPGLVGWDGALVPGAYAAGLRSVAPGGAEVESSTNQRPRCL